MVRSSSSSISLIVRVFSRASARRRSAAASKEVEVAVSESSARSKSCRSASFECWLYRSVYVQYVSAQCCVSASQRLPCSCELCFGLAV